MESLAIEPPPFVVDFVSILPCYRESQEELTASISNYKWKHAYRASKGVHANELILGGDAANDNNAERVQFLKQPKSGVRGTMLFVVADGCSDFDDESDTVKAIRSILNITGGVSAWRESLGCRFFEVADYDTFEGCKIVVIVKGADVAKGKRFSQCLCCRILLALTQRFPTHFVPENVLLTDADTAFTVRDIAKSVQLMRQNPKLGAFNVHRRLLNFSALSLPLLLQRIEYQEIILRRTVDSGLGFVSGVEGSFLFLRFAAMCDILDDYSVYFENTPAMACKFNACNLGEDW